jgi:nucleotide-binding universal stress UspA family protein
MGDTEMTDSKSAPIETILCAFDFSETARVALEQALWFARQHGARLVLAHIVEPIPLGPYPVLVAPGNDLAIRDIATRRIEDLAASLASDELELDLRVELGHPGVQLIEIAVSIGADLVVLGTRGLTGLEHLVMGSTAEYVVRRCGCPVLTVHPSDRVLVDSVETVVLPTDLSPDSTSAIDAFIEIFDHAGRPRVVLVHVDQAPPYLEPFKHEALLRLNERDVVKEEIELAMAPVAERLRAADFEVETAVLDGEPVSVIAELAAHRDADLIMLSTHGRSAIVNALLGRTAQRIVQHAPCPVLTVRPQERAVSE